MPPPPASLDVETVVVHGHHRAYVRAGSGPALVLLHGIGSSLDTWDRVLPALARTRTVIAPDLLGHGRSAKPRADYSLGGYANSLRDLLTLLEIDRVTVVGHSFGGGVAMQFAYQFPERCARVVLVGAGGVGQEVNPLLRLATVPGAGLALQAVNLPGVRGVVGVGARSASRLPLTATHDLGELWTVVSGLQDAGARRAFLRLLRTVVDLRGQSVTMLDRCYLAARVPVQLVWGEHDLVVPTSHAEEAHAAMPGSRLAVLPGAGHFPHRDDPDGFVAVVEEFLRTTRPARHDRASWRALLREGGRARVDAGSHERAATADTSA